MEHHVSVKYISNVIVTKRMNGIKIPNKIMQYCLRCKYILLEDTTVDL